MAISGIGYNKSKSESESGQKIWGPQAEYLQALFGQGSGLAAGQEGIQADMSRMAQSFMPGINSGFAALMGLSDPSAQINTQADALQLRLGKMFREEINPALSQGAVQAGGFGGGRHGVAQGVATGQIADVFRQGYSDIVGNANAQAMAAASSLPGYGSSAMNLGMAPYQAAWMPLQNMKALIGNPTPLAYNKQESESSGFNLGFG